MLRPVDPKRLAVADGAEPFLDQQRQHVAHHLRRSRVLEPQGLANRIGYERFRFAPMKTGLRLSISFLMIVMISGVIFMAELLNETTMPVASEPE